jgi:hypothetical protein
MDNKYSNLGDLFTAIANAIRSKTGSTDTIVADDFPAAIKGISGGSSSTGIVAYCYDETKDYEESFQYHYGPYVKLSDEPIIADDYVSVFVVATYKDSYGNEQRSCFEDSLRVENGKVFLETSLRNTFFSVPHDDSLVALHGFPSGGLWCVAEDSWGKYSKIYLCFNKK